MGPAHEMARITVAVRDSTAYRQEAFTGRWIVYRPAPDQWRVWIGDTARGRVVVYVHPVGGWESNAELHDFDTLDQAETALSSDPRIPVDVWDNARHPDTSDAIPSCRIHSSLAMTGMDHYTVNRDI